MPRLSEYRPVRLEKLGLSLVVLGALITAASAWTWLESRDAKSDALPDPAEALNSWVLAQMETYSDHAISGTVPRHEQWNSMGITRDIHYMGEKFWEANPDGRPHCSGLIFEVYLGACEDSAGGRDAYELPGVGLNDFRSFQRAFFGADGNERTMVDALVTRGLGVVVTDLEQVQPGDLIQFWRFSGTGHSAVFLDWERDGLGQINGIRFWSAQRGEIGEATEQVAYEHEQVGVDRSRIYIVRAVLPTARG